MPAIAVRLDQYWRLITSAFLHENFVHIGFNMYLLYLLGVMLEPAIGSMRFAAIYFTSLLCGSCGALVATSAPSLGASGAIFGLMGAAAVELRARGFSVMQSGIGMLIVFNLVLSFTLPGISVGAHIGGLIGGALAGLAFRATEGRRSLLLGLAACLLLSVVAVIGALAAARHRCDRLDSPCGPFGSCGPCGPRPTACEFPAGGSRGSRLASAAREALSRRPG